MSEKRRDNKNRVLRNGESQRSDGRYAYKYIDTDGKQQFVYSWKLEKTDRLPKGKRDDHVKFSRSPCFIFYSLICLLIEHDKTK